MLLMINSQNSHNNTKRDTYLPLVDSGSRASYFINEESSRKTSLRPCRADVLDIVGPDREVGADILHQRLGHPSASTMKRVHNMNYNPVMLVSLANSRFQ